MIWGVLLHIERLLINVCFFLGYFLSSNGFDGSKDVAHGSLI